MKNHILQTLLIVLLGTHAASSIAAEGFFRVEQRNGKWLVLDPDGKPFHLRGCNHYGDGSHMPWNLATKHGDATAWRASLRDRHREWGFTFLPPSIGPSAVNPDTLEGIKTQAKLVTRTPEWPAADFAALDFPFTAFLEVGKQYMSGPGMPDVWSAAFLDAVDARCREFVAPLKDDRNLIGYHFCHNPPWSILAPSAQDWIKDCTKPGSAGLKEWVKLMRQIYGSIERWRETYGVPIKEWKDIEKLESPLNGYVSMSRLTEDKEAFLQRICEQWHRVYHDTIRRHDANHLIMGDRNTLHLQPAPAQWAFQIMARYIDVLSVNVMGPPDTVYGVLETATRNWNGPILLADTGAGVFTGGTAKAGYQARDLSEFEEVYSGMMTMSVEHPQIIGFGWCGWFETPHPGGRSGIVDVRTDEPHPDILAIVKKWNSWMAEKAQHTAQ